MTDMREATAPNGGVIEQLNRTSSAEEFFALLGVDYDPKHLNVVRLHILRRMGQYLVSEDFSGMPDDEVTQRCKAVLEQAYEDFLKSSPLDERVFKVLKDAVAPPKPKTFVSLTTLK
jgi:nitrogenase-stabilizing/protective protein